MIVLEQLRHIGFTLKPVDTGLYIEPIDELTNTQRQWIIDHKPEIRRKLLDERWQWFLSLAPNHGIHPDVAAAEFPAPEDWLDVIEPTEHDDDRLRGCMATLCNDVRAKQCQFDYESGRWVPLSTGDWPT